MKIKIYAVLPQIFVVKFNSFLHLFLHMLSLLSLPQHKLVPPAGRTFGKNKFMALVCYNNLKPDNITTVET